MTDGWIMDAFGDGSDLPLWFGAPCLRCKAMLGAPNEAVVSLGVDTWRHDVCPVTNPECTDGGPEWCCIDWDGTGLWCESCLRFGQDD